MAALSKSHASHHHKKASDGNDSHLGRKSDPEIRKRLREVHLRVTAPPEGGKANKSVIKLLSKELGVPKTDIQVKRGDTSHHKMLELDCEQSLVDAWVESLD